MFNKETEYALRSLVYIKAKNRDSIIPGVNEISNGIDAPRYFIAKILHRLVKNGFLKSLKGKGGGFYLDDSKPEIKIIDLVNSFEGSGAVSGCLFGLEHCDSNNPCPLHEKYAPIKESIESLLSSETVRSLAENFTFKPL
jgi:Rrf2 family protein